MKIILIIGIISLTNYAISINNYFYYTDNLVIDFVIKSNKQKDTLDNFREKLLKEYPEGINIEIIKEKETETKRLIIIRNKKANEYKEIKSVWGGVYYFKNGECIAPVVYKNETKLLDGEHINGTSNFKLKSTHNTELMKKISKKAGNDEKINQ